jgi:hypothetical protein
MYERQNWYPTFRTVSDDHAHRGCLPVILTSGPRERVGELPPVSLTCPSHGSRSNVLIAAEQALLSVGDRIEVHSPRMGDPCT